MLLLIALLLVACCLLLVVGYSLLALSLRSRAAGEAIFYLFLTPHTSHLTPYTLHLTCYASRQIVLTKMNYWQ